jgi:hypothetical protein
MKVLMLAVLIAAALSVTRAASATSSVPEAPRDHKPFPGPRYYVIGDEAPATAANAQRYVGLAHNAMASCQDLKAATTEYRTALSALSTKQYRVAMADSRNIVDDCTSR